VQAAASPQYGKSLAAANNPDIAYFSDFSAWTWSVFSQVKSGSFLPKCP
jgi:hypothetical protein